MTAINMLRPRLLSSHIDWLGMRPTWASGAQPSEEEAGYECAAAGAQADRHLAKVEGEQAYYATDKYAKSHKDKVRLVGKLLGISEGG